MNTLGHAHPKLTKVLTEQVGRLMHTSNLYRITAQELAADRIAAISGMDRVFFCNSGCEANEAAIKLARLYGHNKGIELPSIIVMDQAFHGRTLATLSATGNTKVHKGFEPLVPGFVRVPFNDIEAVRDVAARDKSVVAVLVEPIQGEGGINVSTLEYLRALRAECDKHGWLLMLDEVQCGIGRTGKWFAYQHGSVMPDVITLAKGLASGVPIGACVAHGAAADVFKPGNHGSTFGGNPLAATAALATLDIIAEDKLMENAVKTGAIIREGMAAALSATPGLKQIRGMGLMLGIELDRPCGELVDIARDAGLLINVTVENVIRLLPPLVLSEAEAKEIVERLASLVKTFLGKPQPATARG